MPADRTEAEVNGPAFVAPVVSGLVRNTNPDIIFKNEENNDAFPGNENTHRTFREGDTDAWCTFAGAALTSAATRAAAVLAQVVVSTDFEG